MSQSSPPFTLAHDAHRYAVTTQSKGLGTIGRLVVDDVQVDEQTSSDNRITLHGGGLTVVVSLSWLGEPTEVAALPTGVDLEKLLEEGLLFTPPAGSRAERMATLKQEQPELYAARHVLKAVAQTLFGLLGIGALLWAFVQGLLPRIPLPTIPWPQLDLPDVPWPQIAIPWPAIDLPDIPWPQIDLPDIALPAELGTALKILIPIIVAIVVAADEVAKRRKRAARGSGVESRESEDER